MQSYAERMELIRAAHQKLMTKPKRKSANRQDRGDERFWTDASKYANEYYGEAYRATTRYDNEWD